MTAPVKEGIGVDSAGNPTVDPSLNVLRDIEAANRRQDDLREAEKDHIREVLTLRAELGTQDSKCAAEIASLRSEFFDRLDRIREGHAKQLRDAEAARIDAIRAVDTEQVRQAAEVQATGAGILAATVDRSAEAMRTQMAQATEAATQRLQQATEPLTKDIADLRRAQYEAQGQKTEVSEGQQRGGSTALWVGLAFSAFMVVLLLIGTVVTVIVATGP